MGLTDKQKIERIEMAPKEVQTMVAKAFIREDIEDENNGGNRKWLWIIAAVLLLLVIVKIIKNKK